MAPRVSLDAETLGRLDIRSLAELFAKERAACVLNEQFLAEISQTKDAQRCG
jgi:hypothetical protein